MKPVYVIFRPLNDDVEFDSNCNGIYVCIMSRLPFCVIVGYQM